MLSRRGLKAEDGYEQGGIVADLADGGGDLGVVGLADENRHTATGLAFRKATSGRSAAGHGQAELFDLP